MHVLILGAGGMLGRKLAAAIAAAGHIGGTGVSRLTLADIAEPAAPAFARDMRRIAVNIADPGVAPGLIADRPDMIFHLAAVVSGEAEADFDKGYAVNLDATRALFEAIRITRDYRPRVVFTSSIAVFGPPFPTLIPTDHHLTPATSYGTQKAITELLLNDYSRRGFMDGIALRLPTLCIRPGAPNRAASSFFSGILREPLAGLPAILPVPDTVRHWFASPRAATGFLLHAAMLDLRQLGVARALTMPGLSATVADQIAALGRIAGPKATALIRREPDPFIERIVSGWAGALDASRATALGFRAETSFDQIVQVYLEDDLPSRPAMPPR
jgi:D-erythronate 2-dehydrogenase